jgi:hypothetical protein
LADGNGGEAPFARFEISPAISNEAPEHRKARRVEALGGRAVSIMLTSNMVM